MAERGEQPETDESAQRLAAELRRLNDVVMERVIDADTADAVAAAVGQLADSLSGAPVVGKAEKFGMHNRIAVFIETGAWPDPPPDGSRLEFDVGSCIGGALNPISLGAVYTRDGDEVVGRVTVGHCFEGPPERVHGGIICAIFDEVMGSVFRATGTASAFTGELAVRFEAAAPIGAPLEFRARQVDSDGRKRFLEGEGHSAAGRFATATATFIEMRPEHLA